MAKTLQLQDLLKGYRVDRDNIQSVGNMTVVPIVGETEFTNVADQNQITLNRDVNYGSLEFKNTSGQIGIAIQGWALIDNSQKAQDRTIPMAHLIKGSTSKLIPANCIQHTQHGTFDVSKVKQDEFMILPPSLRGVALKNATYHDSNLGALWPHLKTWSEGLDCDANGLTAFFTKYENKLDQFVAQFEPVEKQLGAIVFVNDQLVSVDIVPKYETWKYMWKALIRDSYGAEALRNLNKNECQTPAFDFSSVKSIDDLETAFDSMKNEFYDKFQNTIMNVLGLNVNYEKLDEIGEISLLKLEGSDFIGQTVSHGNHFVYLSLVSTTAKRKVDHEGFSALRRDPYGSTGFSFT